MEITPAFVLIIESHPMMRSALCTAIAAEPDLKAVALDFTTKESMNISIIDDVLFFPSKPDIILLALGNPGRNELEVLSALCKTLPCTPILALTNNEVVGQEEAALDHGAQAVLTKAAPRAELIRVLRELRTKAFMNHSENQLEQEVNGNIS